MITPLPPLTRHGRSTAAAAYGKGPSGRSKAKEAAAYFVNHPEEFGDGVHARTACMEKFDIEETQRSNLRQEPAHKPQRGRGARMSGPGVATDFRV